MKAQPTRQTTYTAQTVRAIVKDFAPFSFFGFTAAKPMANRMSVQNTKISSDFASARSHFAESSGRDRKSTRLNSSHGYISYAVFCLKKKIQVTQEHDA